MEIMNTATRAKGTAFTSMSCWIANFFIVCQRKGRNTRRFLANSPVVGTNHSTSYRRHWVEILHLLFGDELHERHHYLPVVPVSCDGRAVRKKFQISNVRSTLTVKPKEFREFAASQFFRKDDD